MKHSNFEDGKVVPSNLINPMAWDTVLESVNDPFGQSQSTGLSVTSGSGLQTGSSRNLRAKFLLALGAASVLVTATPLASYAEIVAMNQEWDFLPQPLQPPQPPQPFDIDGDGLPDLSCTASVTFDDGRANGEVECIDSNGEAVSVEDGICDLPKRDEDSIDDNDQTGTQVCPEGSADKYLAIKTSSDRNALVKVVINADRLEAKAVAWGYERCAGQGIGIGQTTGGESCPVPQPPSGLTSQIDSSGNVILTWKDNSDNETGFKVYRDGEWIEMTAANVISYSDNVTSYSDTSWPCGSLTVIYTVVATNEGQDSELATIKVERVTGGDSCTSLSDSLPIPLPPSELTSQIDSSGNVILTWKDNSDNETGVKVSRDGKQIGTTAANVTNFSDPSLPLDSYTVTYAVVATNGGGDSKPATAPPLVVAEPPPPNSVRLFVVADGPGSGKVTTSPGGVSCEVSDCHYDPKDPLVPKCNPQKCWILVKVGTSVTLTPDADRGSYFNGWGGHEDCKDVPMMMTNGKLCIAFFRQNGPNDRLRPPEETRIPQGLCEGVAFDSEGKNKSTSAQFEGKVLVNGVDVATVKTTDQVDILGYIRVDSQHQSLSADIFASASHQATVQDKLSYWMVENDKFSPWDENPAHLVPFRKVVLSSSELSVEVYHGTMPASGIMKFHLGYRLEDGTIVCSSKPIELKVAE